MFQSYSDPDTREPFQSTIYAPRYDYGCDYGNNSDEDTYEYEYKYKNPYEFGMDRY